MSRDDPESPDCELRTVRARTGEKRQGDGEHVPRGQRKGGRARDARVCDALATRHGRRQLWDDVGASGGVQGEVHAGPERRARLRRAQCELISRRSAAQSSLGLGSVPNNSQQRSQIDEL